MAAEALALSWASTWLKTREGARRNSFDDAPPYVAATLDAENAHPPGHATSCYSSQPLLFIAPF